MESTTPIETFILEKPGMELVSRLGDSGNISIPYLRLLEVYKEGETVQIGASELPWQYLALDIDFGGMTTYRLPAIIAASVAIRMLEQIFIHSSKAKVSFGGQWLDRLLAVRDNMPETLEAENNRTMPGMAGNTGPLVLGPDDVTEFDLFKGMMDSLYREYFQARTLTEGDGFCNRHSDSPGSLALDFVVYVQQKIDADRKKDRQEEPVKKEESKPTWPPYSMDLPIIRKARANLTASSFVLVVRPLYTFYGPEIIEELLALAPNLRADFATRMMEQASERKAASGDS